MDLNKFTKEQKISFIHGYTYTATIFLDLHGVSEQNIRLSRQILENVEIYTVEDLEKLRLPEHDFIIISEIYENYTAIEFDEDCPEINWDYFSKGAMQSCMVVLERWKGSPVTEGIKEVLSTLGVHSEKDIEALEGLLYEEDSLKELRILKKYLRNKKQCNNMGENMDIRKYIRKAKDLLDYLKNFKQGANRSQREIQKILREDMKLYGIEPLSGDVEIPKEAKVYGEIGVYERLKCKIDK